MVCGKTHREEEDVTILLHIPTKKAKETFANRQKKRLLVTSNQSLLTLNLIL